MKKKLMAGLLALAGLSSCTSKVSTPICAARITPASFFTEVSHVEKLAEGFRWAEGPCWVEDKNDATKSYLLFGDIPNRRVMKWNKSEGLTEWRKSEGGANGHALNASQGVFSAEEVKRRIVQDLGNGEIKVLIEKDAEGRRLNSPNDLCWNKGLLYFSDPIFGIRSKLKELKEQQFQSLYSWNPETKEVRRETTDELELPNGVCFSPDGKWLYAVESGKAQQVLRFSVEAQTGKLGKAEFFCKAYGADGIKTDALGNVYIANFSGVSIHDSKGTLVSKITIPGGATNLCFGGKGGTALFVTSSGALYSIVLNEKRIK